MQINQKSTINFTEAAIVSIICFGLFTYWSVLAVLAGFPVATFSNTSNTLGVFLEIGLALAALYYLKVINFDTSSLYPQPTLQGTIWGVAIFGLTWLVGLLATAPFDSAKEPMVVEFSFTGLSLASTVIFAIVNGTFEEVFLLGVLVRGLRGYGLSVAIGVPLLIRVLYHLYQGPLGAIWIFAFGLTFTLIYIRKQQLWPLVFAHILWDIVPVVTAQT